jgi:hypothetical protein
MSNPTALQVLAYGARTKGRRMAVESLRRTIDVCSCCGEQVDFDDAGYPIDACPAHPTAKLVQAEICTPKVALGYCDGSRRSLELQGLVLPAHLMASVGAAS